MKHSKSLSLIILFAAMTVVLLVSVSRYIVERIEDMNHTQALRSRMQARIHESIHGWYDAQIRDTSLISRCGITAYAVTLLDFDGNEFTLYYNIDNAAPVHQDLLNGCPARVTGSAAIDAAVMDAEA